MKNHLYQAILNKKIAGAGLDVSRIEPLPAGDKLWDLGIMF
jgi:phosphoglycerate dehydrogenase-like enzyme